MIEYRCEGILDNGKICGRLLFKSEIIVNVEIKCPKCGEIHLFENEYGLEDSVA